MRQQRYKEILQEAGGEPAGEGRVGVGQARGSSYQPASHLSWAAERGRPFGDR